MKKKFKIILPVAIILALTVVFLSFYSHYLEIKEIGQEYTSVFFTDIFATASMTGILFVMFFAFISADLLFVRKNMELALGEVPAFLKRKYVFSISAVVSLAGAVVLSRGLYRKFLLFINAVKAGILDPVFNKDISYYFFAKDFLESIAGVGIALCAVILAANIVLYFNLIAKGNILDIKELLKSQSVFAHLAGNAIVLCVLFSFTYYFKGQDLLLSQTGTVIGAGFTDVNVLIPFYRFAPYILLVCAVVAAVFLFKKSYKITVSAILLFPVMLVLVNFVAAGVNFFYVRPNEVKLEKEYIERNIEYTKSGFNMQNITEKVFKADESLTRNTIESRRDIVDNIRITDPQATLEVLNSTKSIRNYYTFNDCDIVEYEIDGKHTAVNIAARELDITKLDPNANNYINRTFKYTHGYGLAMNGVNSVNAEGQPDFVISDMPVESVEGAPRVTEPRIYYGEKTNNYCIVNTGIKEFDYVASGVTKEENYKGTKSGIRMNMFNRVLFGLKNLDYTMLISGYITPESRFLPNRNILERVNKAVPFMGIDPDPYIVVSEEGKLLWIVDLYTATNQMPYAKRLNGISYIRNSAKAVVDAYEGTVKVYVTDESDCIVKTYRNIYPQAFEKEKFPEDLNNHIRYPEYLFNMQSEIYLRYHMDNAEIFYANSDLWMRAKEKYRGEEAVDVQPYYNLLSVDDFGKDRAQLVLMMPFVPANKENLVSWLAADSYGNLISYKFPSGRTVYGTLHIENRIDSDADISKELSLWDQGGSTVLRGNVLVIPIEDSIIYVEPVYITANNEAAVPEVKRIIMAYGDDIVMAETVEGCFDKLFGQKTESGDANEDVEDVPVEIPDEEIEIAEDYAKKAVEAYDRMHSALKDGDWVAFGQAMDELGFAIEDLRGE